eukprot:6459527-Amphidinium_carterae.3
MVGASKSAKYKANLPLSVGCCSCHREAHRARQQSTGRYGTLSPQDEYASAPAGVANPAERNA